MTLRALRSLIHEALDENAWANYSQDNMSPVTDEREPMERMRLKGEDGTDELPSHLLDADKVENDEDVWGPVPPRKDQDVFFPQSDPYSQDWNVLPRPPYTSGR
jgi:hypothetical protein